SALNDTSFTFLNGLIHCRNSRPCRRQNPSGSATDCRYQSSYCSASMWARCFHPCGTGMTTSDMGISSDSQADIGEAQAPLQAAGSSVEKEDVRRRDEAVEAVKRAALIEHIGLQPERRKKCSR